MQVYSVVLNGLNSLSEAECAPSVGGVVSVYDWTWYWRRPNERQFSHVLSWRGRWRLRLLSARCCKLLCQEAIYSLYGLLRCNWRLVSTCAVSRPFGCMIGSYNRGVPGTITPVLIVRSISRLTTVLSSSAAAVLLTEQKQFSLTLVTAPFTPVASSVARWADRHCRPPGIAFSKMVKLILFTARRNPRIASAVLATAIPSVCPSVCLSVTRWYCVKT